MHPAIASTRPLVFAHRGGAALAPENSIPAFDRGLAEGADGLELDVHLSRDGVVVVHHDGLLDRTTNAVGPIGERTAAELAALDVTGRAGRPGERAGVPTLREVLRRYPDVPLIVELKTASQALVRAVVDEVRAAGAAGRVCLGSFSWRALRAARAYRAAHPDRCRAPGGADRALLLLGEPGAARPGVPRAAGARGAWRDPGGVAALRGSRAPAGAGRAGLGRRRGGRHAAAPGLGRRRPDQRSSGRRGWRGAGARTAAGGPAGIRLGAHGAPANERRGALGPHERVSRGVGQSPT